MILIKRRKREEKEEDLRVTEEIHLQHERKCRCKVNKQREENFIINNPISKRSIRLKIITKKDWSSATEVKWEHTDLQSLEVKTIFENSHKSTRHLTIHSQRRSRVQQSDQRIGLDLDSHRCRRTERGSDIEEELTSLARRAPMTRSGGRRREARWMVKENTPWTCRLRRRLCRSWSGRRTASGDDPVVAPVVKDSPPQRGASS